MTDYEMVILGAGAGSTDAICRVVGGLSPRFRLPLVVLQHHADSLKLAQALRQVTRMPVVEVDDKQTVVGSTLFVAPPGYHLLVEERSFSLSRDAPSYGMRPAIDVALESAAFAFGSRLIAVILPGSGFDGVRGVGWVQRRGGKIIAQTPGDGSESTMLEAVLARNPVDWVLPLEEIANCLSCLCGELQMGLQ